jgi:hypothetical protein
VGNNAKLDDDDEVKYILTRMEHHINVIYSERNLLVFLIMKLCGELNFTHGMRRNHTPTQAGWDYIAYFDLPSGQCCYHIPNSELPVFRGMPTYPHEEDGHGQEEQIQRLLDPKLEQALLTGRSWGLSDENTLGSTHATRILERIEDDD